MGYISWIWSAAARFISTGLFNLNNLGTQIGHELGSIRRTNHVTALDHANALQSTKVLGIGS
jgi:hypothetical protein